MSGNHVHRPWNAKRAFCALACCLVVLLACAAVFAGSSAAKYVEQDVGADSARVAGIVVEAEPDDSAGAGTIDLGNAQAGNAEYRFTVSNEKDGTVSEAAYEYDIVVEATNGDPDGVTVSLGDGSSSKTFVSGKNMVSFDNAGVLPAGAQSSHNHVLTFSADGMAGGNMTFEVSVHAEQID